MDAAKSNPDEVFNDALRKARLGDLEGAAARLHRVIELEGESAEVCRLLGKVDLHAGRLEEAAQWWRRALELSPADAGSARCLRVAGRYRRFRRIAAIAIVAVLIVAAGFFLWHQRESSGETQAAIARLEGHLIRIEDLVRPVAETFPKEEPPARPAIAEPAPAPVMPIEVRYKDALDSALNGDLQAARARFETLLSEAGTGNPLQANIHFWLGRCLYELDETRRALEQFNSVLQLYPGHGKEGDSLLDAGRCLRRLERADEARRVWEKLAAGSYDPRLQEIARALLQTLPLSR